MIERILQTFDEATARDMREGLTWYDRASDLATALAAGSPLNHAQCAGIIAALSPRVTWAQNVRAATTIVEHVAQFGDDAPAPVVSGTGANRAKAWAIAQGADPDSVLGGPKVRAFWAAICGDPDSVTVDVWAARIADPTGTLTPTTVSGYARIADAYREAASLRNIAPRDLQAVTWVAYRRLHGDAS